MDVQDHIIGLLEVFCLLFVCFWRFLYFCLNYLQFYLLKSFLFCMLKLRLIKVVNNIHNRKTMKIIEEHFSAFW